MEDSIKAFQDTYLGTEPTRTEKRTLSIRDKEILYEKAKGRCENPKCNKKIKFIEMQVGHKTAHSKGGKTNLSNCVCLCYGCNRLQGTDSWATFLRKQGIKTSTKPPIKKSTKGTTKKPTTTKATKTKRS
jgi:5-methylcytosine-specific restriction endonuclease McrA